MAAQTKSCAAALNCQVVFSFTVVHFVSTRDGKAEIFYQANHLGFPLQILLGYSFIIL